MLGAPNVASESHRWLQLCMCSGKIALEIETATMCTTKNTMGVGRRLMTSTMITMTIASKYMVVIPSVL